MTSLSPDFYTYLSQSEGWARDAPQEAQLAVVAGADTVAITLTNVCYYLAKHPKYQRKLHEELDLLFTSGQDHVSDQFLAGKPCLQGIINETLRLHPPVPSALQCLTLHRGMANLIKHFIDDTN
jgi:cytochrome P450 family 628